MLLYMFDRIGGIHQGARGASYFTSKGSSDDAIAHESMYLGMLVDPRILIFSGRHERVQ